MKHNYLTCLLFLSVIALCNAQDKTATDLTSIIAPDTKPVLVSNQFKFTEGASRDKKGNVFFTDQPNDKIWKYDTNGKLSVFLENTGRSNGTYFDKKGNLITCADEKGQLLSISPKGKVKVLLSDLQGHQLNGPNDLWIRNDGGMYFTDPYYQRDYWTRRKSDLDGQKVYFISKDKKEPVAVVADLAQPNGIVGTPDGKYLYIADIRANKTYKYKVNADGTLSEKQLYADAGSDGMTLDKMGNLYLTGGNKGVSIYGLDGKKIHQIDIPRTSNVCFGGKNRDVLFVTAGDAVYTVQMKVKGVE